MRSTKKIVLFARTGDGKASHTRPVAVFANLKSAQAYKAHLAALHAAGDFEAVKVSDPGVHLTGEGGLHQDSKWAVVETPYEPEPPVAAADNASFDY